MRDKKTNNEVSFTVKPRHVKTHSATLRDGKYYVEVDGGVVELNQREFKESYVRVREPVTCEIEI